MRVELSLAILCLLVSFSCADQERVLRRVIKSTPTATTLGRVRLVTIRSSGQENGAVKEISGKEAATFGSRNANETSQTTQQQKSSSQSQTQTLSPVQSSSTKSNSTPSSPKAQPSTSSTSAPSTVTPTSSSTTSTPSPDIKPKASERIQSSADAEVLVNAPSWQTMTAVEAPAAMLIATGTRRVSSGQDELIASSSLNNNLEAEESASAGDLLRSSAVKGGRASFSSSNDETFSRLRQQTVSTKTSQSQQHQQLQQQQQQQEQQSYFYPSQEIRSTVSKTSRVQATKNHWYQPTTARPALVVQQEQHQQRYEQQNDNYVEQQTAEYGAAPVGQAEPFAFDFRTEDNGNGQYRKEESDKNGVVHGSYGYFDANGIYRHVEYVADHNGFRANIKSNEPGLSESQKSTSF